jgi:hypothetical protein
MHLIGASSYPLLVSEVLATWNCKSLLRIGWLLAVCDSGLPETVVSS